jgi:AcrR family transcriptional regulator
MEDGPEATVTEIARRAGLSEGSFFTYFSSKEDLMGTLVTERSRTLQALGRKHARGEGPAMERLEGYMWDAAEELAPHRFYLEIAHVGPFDPANAEVIGRLIRQAQDDGALRLGVTATDVHALLMIVTLAAAPYLPGRPDLWRRFLALAIAGLRPDAARSLG